ncbi:MULTISPECIES: PPE family protein [unclassified Mycobacterium]|uniref:PPE family protein n=1 Tax=unclassified Mycobacterium TaxID=2642494 RepID=UPI000AB69AD0|nr:MULTISPECIES: PPE family protein [unclassified Mycobacterium]
MSTIWETLPPEVSSAMLSTGPGPGSLLAAGAAWRALAVQYADAATQLAGILATVQGGAWDGPTAQQYVAAHGPFLDWLTSMSAVAEAIAERHDTVVAAYSAAVAAMPTLAELAANHAVHTSLLATNFLGLNTIPIALNEADYGRMWLQAAATMRVYEGVSTVSLESSPTASPAPAITSAEAGVSVRAASSASGQFTFRDPAGVVVEQIRKLVNALAEWARDLPEPLRSIATQVLDGAAAAVNAKLFSILTYSVLDPLIYFGPFAAIPAPAAAAAASAAASAAAPAEPAPELTPGRVAESVPVSDNHVQDRGEVPAVGTAAPAATASAPAPQSGSALIPSSSPAPMAPMPDAPYLYAVGVGPDGEGSAPTVRGAATQAVSAPVQEPVAASAAVAERRAARRRRKSRQHRHEPMAADGRMTLPMPGEPEVSASGSHAELDATARGLVGSRATVPSEVVRKPMLPSTWARA